MSKKYLKWDKNCNNRELGYSLKVQLTMNGKTTFK
jgi:hypothetical protein